MIFYYSVDNSKQEASGVNGSIKDALEKTLRPDSSPLASVRKNIIVKDDPNCPNLFKLEKLKKKSDPGTIEIFNYDNRTNVTVLRPSLDPLITLYLGT